jgi:polysaccharide chain length determinant protein (PEP-CTERM system associated)
LFSDVRQQIGFYVNALWRRRWYGLGVAWSICLVAWASIIFMPDVYQSSARIYVDTSGMLQSLLRGVAVESNMGLEVRVMGQFLLSEPNLRNVVRQVDLDLTVNTPEGERQLAASLKNRIKINLQNENLFSISYEDKNAERARDVVQALLTNFVEQNLGHSREDMDTAQTFLLDQIASYEKQLVEAEERLAKFKQENMHLLPGELGFQGKLGAVTAQLSESRAEFKDAVARRDELKRQLAEIPATYSADLAGSGIGPPSNLEVRILEFESRLDELLIKYTEQHPDVLMIRRRLEALQDQREQELNAFAEMADSLAQDSDSVRVPNPFYDQVRISLIEEETRIASLQNRVERLSSETSRLELLAHKFPELEAERKRLDRDYNIIKSKYEQLLSRRESAKISEERETKTDKVQFRIIEPPQVPLTPNGPNRILYFLAALVAAFGAAGFFCWALIMVSDKVTNPIQLYELVGLPILGTISEVDNFFSKGRRFLGASGFVSLVGVLFLSTAGLILIESSTGFAGFREVLGAPEF